MDPIGPATPEPAPCYNRRHDGMCPTAATRARVTSSYYADKVPALADLFGGLVRVEGTHLSTERGRYPIVDDVIILLEPERRPLALRGGAAPGAAHDAELVQYSFGAESRAYREILPEHRGEFADLFDLVALESLRGLRVCDLGCGIGRWAHFVAPHCRELVLVDFSDAIFLARRNLAGTNALFFLGDLTALPFRPAFADFAFSIGVLHHLPIPALQAVQRLATYAPRLLVYVYYALDNRPWHYRALFRGVDAARRRLSHVRDPKLRRVVAWTIAAAIYKPLVALGHLCDVAGHGRLVPLFEMYRGKSLRRIEQDAYDRFFTSVEQRVSRKDIVEVLSPHFTRLRISERPPYWHFLCEG